MLVARRRACSLYERKEGKEREGERKRCISNCSQDHSTRRAECGQHAQPCGRTLAFTHSLTHTHAHNRSFIHTHTHTHPQELLQDKQFENDLSQLKLQNAGKSDERPRTKSSSSRKKAKQRGRNGGKGRGEKSKKHCARFFEIRIANHAPLSLRLNLDGRLKEKEFATITAEQQAATVVAVTATAAEAAAKVRVKAETETEVGTEPELQTGGETATAAEAAKLAETATSAEHC